MQYRFPIKKVIINGKEYIHMSADVFYDFFLVMSEKLGVDKNLIEEVAKMYKQAQKHKKKRIRLKKEKQVLMIMFEILYAYVKRVKEPESKNKTMKENKIKH